MRYARNRVGRSAPMLAMLLACSAQAGTTWRSDWFVPSPQTLDTHEVTGFGAKPSQAVAFADDGEVVVAAQAMSSYDVQVTRRHADGSLRWVANLDSLELFDVAVHAIRALPDGGAILAWGEPGSDDYNRIARIDASGSLQWLREVPTGWLEFSDGRVVSAGCAGVSVVDADSGSLVWQREIPLYPAGCHHGGLAVDADGAVYVLRPLGEAFAETGFGLRKYSAAGEPLWSVERDDPSGSGDLVGVGVAHVFVRTTYRMESFDRMNGADAWSTQVHAVRVVLSADGLREPIVAGGSSIRRLAADGSGERWVAPVADARVLDPVGDALLVATPTSRLRLDAATGAVSWTIPDGTLQTTWLGFGALGSGGVRAIGRPWRLASPGLPLVDRVLDFATGEILADAPAPPQAQGVLATRLRDPAGGIVEAAFAPSPTGAQLVSRRLDEANGSTLWQRAEAAPELSPGTMFLSGPGMAIGDDEIILTYGEPWDACLAGGWIMVSRQALADGAPSWRVNLRDIDQRCTSASTPVIDDAGNVYVSTVANIECPGGANPPCYRRSLYKLAAADGSVAWRRDEVVYDAYEIVFTRHTLLADGDDVLAYAEYSGWVQRVAGSDGSLQWQQPLLPGCCVGERLRHRDAQHLLEHSVDYNSMNAATVHWRSLDTLSGLPEWNASVDVTACYGISGCQMPAEAVMLPDGDLVLLHQREYAAYMWRLRGDGSGGFEERLLVPADERVPALVYQPVFDEQGTLWAVLNRRVRANYSHSLSFLVRIDPESGGISEQQALYRTDDAPGSDRSIAWLLAAGGDAHATVGWTFRAAPDPLSSGLSRIDANVVAHGNLSVSIETDRTVVGHGEAVVVQAAVRYSGDAPADGVRAVLSDDWGGIVRDASCTSLGGGACMLELRNGEVVASFDAADGGGIDVQYTIDAQGSRDAHALIATVQGGLGLAEADTLDNFAFAEVMQALFVDGFEAAP